MSTEATEGERTIPDASTISPGRETPPLTGAAQAVRTMSQERWRRAAFTAVVLTLLAPNKKGARYGGRLGSSSPRVSLRSNLHRAFCLF